MRRKGRDRVPVTAEINVVSLIDVMMLLLVIFMITAPMMQGGVDIVLPKAESRPLDPKSGVVITVERSGSVLVDGTRMPYAEFRAAAKALVGSKAQEGVYVQGDARAAYGDVVRVLGVLQAAGITSVGLQTEPETIER